VDMPKKTLVRRPWTRAAPDLSKHVTEWLAIQALASLTLASDVRLEAMKLTGTRVHYELSMPQEKQRARR